MHPVPDHPVTTPYGRRGPYWSCDRDGDGNGIHTGADMAAPVGTKVVAARGGRARYCSHGAAFGFHQLEVMPGDGTRDFYAHMRTRSVPDGSLVLAGDKLGEVGSEGNITGPHLHFERHAVAVGGWSCLIVRDPAPSLNYQPPASGGGGSSGEDTDVAKFSRTRLTKALKLKADEWTTITWDHVSSGSAGKAGQAAVMIGPSAYSATLLATVTATGEVARTRMLERQQDKGGTWKTSETYPNVEHPLTGGKTYLADTRVQNVPKDTRLVAQVNLPNGGTIENAELNVLYFQ